MSKRKYLIATAGAAVLAVVAGTAYPLVKDLIMPAEVVTAHASTLADVDTFKAAMGTSLEANPAGFSIESAAKELSQFRVEGQFAVCSDNLEVEAKQYVSLAEHLALITPKFPAVGSEVNRLLKSDIGLTDCQYRVLEAVARHVSKSQ